MKKDSVCSILESTFKKELELYLSFDTESIKPASSATSTTHQKKILSQLTVLKGHPSFYPYLGSGRGKGAFVEMLDGSVKLDWITGIGVHFFGHAHTELIKAGIESAFQDIAMQGHLQQNHHCISLQTKLLNMVNRNHRRMSHVFLSTSGAMANENALKILFCKTRGERLLAFKGCFAGRTLALATVTDKPENRIGCPESFPVDYIPFFDPLSPKHSIASAVSRLNEYIARYPRKHIGMIFELIQGEGGFYPGTKDFFMALIHILKKNDIPVWIDEIQTFGRTDTPFAFQKWNLDPYVDIVTVGKLTQVCATLYTKELSPPAGLLSQTFSASTQTLKVSETVLDMLCTLPLFGKKGLNIYWHNVYLKHIKALQKKYPLWISPPYGLGSMWALTLGNGDKDTCVSFLKHLYDEGLIGFMCGKSPCRIRFLPPTPCLLHAHFKHAFTCIENAILKMK